jgi:sulfoxide reductase heme-binding subunit YedZ
MRLSGRAFLVLLAVAGLVAVVATDQVVPASSTHQAQLRIWLAARAAGITAYLLLTLQVVLGLVLAHPTNQTTWRMSRYLFPWHENAWVFVLAFLGAHILTIVVDPYAGVGIGGALVPGLSSYRSSAVALGTLALYALLITGLTARYTRRLPPGIWLKIHRASIGVFVLAWLHGVLAGTDTGGMLPVYLATGSAVLAASAYRYWIVRRPRATVGRPGTVPSSPARGLVPHPDRHLEPVPQEVTTR